MRTELIRHHKKLGTTFVYVTHDQTEAMTMGDRIVVMKDGFIQQVDTPQELFDKPSNIFVAGFIGSPQMNFLKGTLNKDGMRYYFEAEGDKHYIPVTKVNETMSGYVGKEVVLGIRPEDVHDDEQSFQNEENSIIEAYVEVRELMGSEVYLYLKYKDKQLMARVPTSLSSKTDNDLKIALDMNNAHLFDVETEKAIIN
jgi:multiple sugar transport system ATP-binding protein